ncbi:MAG: hypothetical protein BV458_03480 [Thermoplasmata archaeon M9B2D]|nr:MAG: hypothetical protein BV458_03480 [Thermoplasmata archaeon M9B2D]
MRRFDDIKPSYNMRGRLHKIYKTKGWESQISKLKEEFLEMCLEIQRVGGEDNTKGNYDAMIEEVGDFLVVRNQFASELMSDLEVQILDKTLESMESLMVDLDLINFYGLIMKNPHARQEIEASMTRKVWRTLDRIECTENEGWL